MNAKILFRCSLTEEKELQSASKYFEVIDSRVKVNKGDLVIPRYSVVPFAKEFFQDIEYLGARTINSYQQFSYIADLRNYVADLGDLTPRTWLASDGVINLPDSSSFILKGETNSKKFEWQDMMFAKNKQAVTEVHSRLLKDGIIGDQQIYVREYVPLKTFITSFKGLPITNEYRFFIAHGKVVSSGYYWSNHYEDLIDEGLDLNPSQVPDSLVQKVITKVGKNSNAFVADFAQTKDGEWIVIELNAFEQSGLSENDPNILYKELRRFV